MRTTIRSVSPFVLAGALVAGVAGAQQPPPVQPAPFGPQQPQPAPPQPQPSPPPAPAAPGGTPSPADPGGYPGGPAPQDPAALPPGAPPAAPGAEAGFGAGASFGAEGFGATGGLEGEGDEEQEPDEEQERAYRKKSLRIQNTINAATGLLHLYSADSGAVGTFRFSLLSSYFTGSGFLCPTCAALDGGESTAEDDVTRIGARVGISATPVEFLEGYLGIHAHATSNNLGDPGLLQVLGDTNLGLKAFMPHEADQLFTAGGAAELWFLNGVGGVGVDGASFGLRGLATADFSNRTKEEDRIPLRAHVNVGYRFDNSGSLVEDHEAQQGGAITRIERFGLGINRVDQLQVALGVEGVFDAVYPFLEWGIDIPVNRQDYLCVPSRRAAGDACLGDAAGFSTTPSRLTVGARVYPWLEGLALLGAFDIGTGATSQFVEEVAPEPPWTLHFGLAYAVDVEPQVEIRRVEVDRGPAPAVAAPKRYIEGLVREAGETPTPIPGAVVRFDGRDVTGMVATDEGTFRTNDLPPGTYTFNVTADGYKPGQCTATIPVESAMGAAPAAPAPGAPLEGNPYPPGPYGPPPTMADPNLPAGTPGPAAGLGGDTIVRVECELDPLPKVGNVEGAIRDAETSEPVGGATVKITDRLNRSLNLTSDTAGAFRFENVPPGPVTITADAPGYLRSVTQLDVKPRQDVSAQISLNKRPTQPNVVVTPQEIKLKKEVHFQHNSAEILPDSMAILEEIADVLRSHGEIQSVEIQGHTDNSGTPDYNLRLSQERAEAVRDALVRNGVAAARLSAKGYGQERPLVPNTTEASRAKNRRVQLMIK